MSVGLTGGLIGSAAGALAQTRSGDVDRAAHEAANQQRQVTNDAQAESAAGIGETSEDQAAADRDADGRRLWEGGRRNPNATDGQSPPSPGDATPVKDLTGESGNLLDLMG